jgi:hypothetical protein
MAASTTRLVYARDLDDLDGSRRWHARAARRGVERRVARGVYVDAGEWEQLTARDQYKLRTRAVVATRSFPGVLSHWTAAVFHGLPLLGFDQCSVHFTVPRATGGRSYPGIAKHCLPLDAADIVTRDGLTMTSIERTVVDLAASTETRTAVTAADYALHIGRYDRTPPLSTAVKLLAAYERRLPFKGHRRARRVLDFAETASDSPLESVSRVNMREMGCPRPVLQQRFDDRNGLIGYSEFYWPEYGIVGEADGRSKYTDAALRGNRTLEQVLLDEKHRGDRLRALNLRVVRWGWDVAVDRDGLRRHLAAEGLPMGVQW